MASQFAEEEREHIPSNQGYRGRAFRGRVFRPNAVERVPAHRDSNHGNSGSEQTSRNSSSFPKQRSQGKHYGRVKSGPSQSRGPRFFESSSMHNPSQSQLQAHHPFTQSQDHSNEGTSTHWRNPEMMVSENREAADTNYRSRNHSAHFNGRGKSRGSRNYQSRSYSSHQETGYENGATSNYSEGQFRTQDTYSQDYNSLIQARNQARNNSSRQTDRREYAENGETSGRFKRFHVTKRSYTEKMKDTEDYIADLATQRERLTEQLTKGIYECMVCCESVKQDHAIWSCGLCFHVFHLGCIRKWAHSSQDECKQFRCPGCQSTTSANVNNYYCFCFKRKNPEWNRREIPHSCGEVCGKSLGDGTTCSHTCTLLCHPGPCPSCSAQTTRSCPCGKTSQLTKCGSTDALLCGNPCEKKLQCGLHTCSQLCHTGPCDSCPITIEQACFCGQNKRQVPCSIESSPEEMYQCGSVCQRTLDCGKHKCDKLCHQGFCESCPFQVDKVRFCPCGKIELAELYRHKKKPAKERKECTDPVPTCGQGCGKILDCGSGEKRHKCAAPCHEGACPPCKLKTVRKCRCGRTEKTILCVDLPGTTEVLCERRCSKKRQCGRHKCVQVCCVDTDHICMMLCGRLLSCGLHRCEALCHAGNCARCYRASFEELTCHCGTEIMYPPVPCGARPPECNQLCIRPSPCGHKPQHNCHPEETCPPCTVLCEKQCYGRHEIRKNVPCHITEISCGKPCGKPMSCGRHTCIMTCHDGPCPATCSQPCPAIRSDCPHPCNVPCHQGSCPGTPCREKVRVQCQCGQRVATVSCEEQQSAFRKLGTAILASKMTALQLGECVDFKDLFGPSGSAKQTKSLECNEECALVERNRRLALALQIQNPNPKPGAPRYPDSLKEWAKKDPRFVQMVHDKLTDLVQLAKQSLGKMRSRQHSFDPMNRDKRQFIHDYCVFFGCETASYDEEPKRNVVATAFGETSFLPAVGLLETTQREMGQRKVPAPPSTKTPQVATASTAVQPPAAPVPSAWNKGPTGSYRTLSDIVKSTPARPGNAPAEVSGNSSGPMKSSAPPASTGIVDYFDFTS